MPKATKRIHVAIERSGDSFTAYAKNLVGMYGQGDSIHEAKASILKSMALFDHYNPGYGDRISAAQVIFHYNIWSFIIQFLKHLVNINKEISKGLPQNQL